MASPTPSDVHVDQILTSMTIALMQDPNAFVAPFAFPIINSDKQSNKYYKYTQADWYREEAQLRAPGTESAGGKYGLTTDSYFCDVYAVHKDIDAQTRANADSVLNLDREAAMWVGMQLLMKLESLFVRDYFAASTWTGTTTGLDQTGVPGAPAANQFRQWDDVSSTPIEDVSGWIDEMQQKTGRKPNTLILGPKTATALKQHPDLIDRIKFTQRGQGTLEILASLMGLDRILEARATRNTAKEGATDNYQFYFGNNALLLYSESSPGPMTASAGYIFAWSGYTGVGGVEGIGSGVRTSKFPLPAIKADRVEAEMAVDMKVVAPDLGIYLSTVVPA